MAESIDVKKKALRREVLSRRDRLSDEAQENAEKILADRLLSHEWYRDAKILLGFASYGSEIHTDAVLQAALRDGKMLYLPRVSGDEMLFYRVQTLKELKIGYKGIREPSKDGELFVYEALAEMEILMLMPGVAFDGKRRRMGYGKGFYDRFLADNPELVSRTIGIAHACQLVETVPCEETDICPAQVLCV